MQTSYWLTKKLPRFPRVNEAGKFDAIVIGGGVTGITAAYLLKKSGLTVALLERDRLAQVDTGHTTAHLTFVTDERLTKLVKFFGEDHARAVWDAGQAAMQQIEEIILSEGIECDHRHVPGFLHASVAGKKDESKSLREGAELAEKLGFDAAFVEQVPYFEKPGIKFANQAKFHPLKYLSALVKLIPGDGSQVFEHSEVTTFGDKPICVTANGHRLESDYVVIATHVPLAGNTGFTSATLFQTKLAPYSSYVIGADLPKGLIPEASFWDTTDPYFYLRVESGSRKDYAIFGGADHKTGQVTNTDECFESLEAKLFEFVPSATVNRRWSGQVIETNDGLPYIGETAERQFVATGFGGNGMTFGTLAAMMARDVAEKQKNPWQELFSVNRKKLRGGTWDYIKENLDYPYYMIKDSLSSADAQSTREVKRGEGKIIRVDGKKVAVSSDDDGVEVAVSAVCTHMGCIVRWNQAESTWDCPCHGSRFHPSGEVIGGPAESPLESVTLSKPSDKKPPKVGSEAKNAPAIKPKTKRKSS